MITLEPPQDNSNKIACVISKGADQLAHMHSLIRAFAGHVGHFFHFKLPLEIETKPLS